MRRASHRRLLGRLAGTAAAAGLVLTGFVATAGPASAAACSGTSGVTVVVDTGSSTSIRCASGDPSSAWKALEATGHSVTPVQQFPSAICRIDGFPSSDPCVRMPPADAYWAFFHASRGGSWTYSSSGATSYDPAPGSVVGFRFGSGQQPRTAPPATSAPAPTPATTTRTTTPRTQTAKPRATVTPRAATTTNGSATARSAAPKPSASPSASATPSASVTASATPTPSSSESDEATTVAAAPTSTDATGDVGTLVVGGALVALVAGGAGWAAWRRRT
ncbi:hypothetical protein [Oryzobacter telluris]|uniref:hypothetical protein n=1 Tax=Oryzobacter telluris TaxID=3149179 RepID=UPI00370DAE24